MLLSFLVLSYRLVVALDICLLLIGVSFNQVSFFFLSCRFSPFPLASCLRPDCFLCVWAFDNVSDDFATFGVVLVAFTMLSSRY